MMEEENKTQQIEETEATPIDAKTESVHFPWTMAIIIGVLIVLMIACFVTIMILGPEDPVTSSAQNLTSAM